MGTTTDRDDPRLGRTEKNPDGTEPMNEVYLVLSEEERAKGFVRPLRRSYEHVGPQGPKYELVDLTEEQKEQQEGKGYIKFEPYPESEAPVLGRYWTQEKLDELEAKPCGAVTHMGLELSETYAREPGFYGATYCVGCKRHMPVGEFVWTADGERVGS